MNVAVLWLINEQGEVLLAQRALTISSNAGLWGPSVSGEIDAGETAEQAAAREALEELGVPLDSLRPQRLHKGTHTTHDGKERQFTFLWAMLPKDRTVGLRLAPREVAATKWVTLTDFHRLYEHAPEEPIISSNTDLWTDIFAHLEAVVANNV